jgi:hypothetical protein
MRSPPYRHCRIEQAWKQVPIVLEPCGIVRRPKAHAFAPKPVKILRAARPEGKNCFVGLQVAHTYTKRMDGMEIAVIGLEAIQ